MERAFQLPPAPVSGPDMAPVLVTLRQSDVIASASPTHAQDSPLHEKGASFN